MNSISLSDLCLQLSGVVRMHFDTPVWVRAEISELRENSTGHCYMELVEKDSDGTSFLAKSKAVCWASTYRIIKPYFEQSTQQSLCPGIKILIAVVLDYHPLYGFTMVVKDIDPTFTVGEIAANKILIIKKLENDGVINMNKELTLPNVIQRIAVISSNTAAGYGDFCDQLHNHTSGFAYYLKLFPAIMQGHQAEVSIINALDKINDHLTLFDVVVIIRGGGATTDLACFDSYNIAFHCAQFPLPVISGIGHQRDVSILDLVAHTSLKTPTAVASFFIDRMIQQDELINAFFAQIKTFVRGRIEKEFYRMSESNLRIRQTVRSKMAHRTYLLQNAKQRLQSNLRLQMLRQTNKIAVLERKIEIHSPAYFLERGYSITTVNGKKVSSVAQVKSGDVIKTYVSDGEFESTI